MENCGPVPMPVGTMVARGFYWQRVVGEGSEYWWERPKNYTDAKVFWTRHVLKGKVEAAKQSEETGEPPVLGHLQFYNANDVNRSLCRKIEEQEWREIFFERHVREKLQMVDIENEDEVQEVKEIREEAAKEKAKSDEKARKKLKMLSLCHLPVCFVPEVPTAKGKAKAKAKAKPKNKSKEKTLPKEKPPPMKKAPAKKSKKRPAAQTPRLGFAI